MFSLSLKQYCNRRLIVVLLLGFSSGLPFALTAGTLQAWFTVSGLSYEAIGLLGLAWLPYSFKFIWAPLLDRYTLPFLGRRRGWIASMQLLLMLAVTIMACMQPSHHPLWITGLAFTIVVLSATQDIAIDAYRTEILLPHERGLGAAMAVAGYRVGILLSGGVALLMASELGWCVTYLLMAASFIIGLLATLAGPDSNHVVPPKTLAEAVIHPWREFFSRHKAILVLLFILFYKLAESFTSSTGSLVTAFLLRGVGFSLATVGTVNKGVGLAATIVGVFLAGGIMLRWGLYRSLMVFGVLQAVTNLFFVGLAIAGHHYPMLLVAVTSDNLAAGMATAAIVAFLMSICDKRYTASQFALFTAIAALPRTLFSAPMGWLADQVTWPTFFAVTFLLALPGLGLLYLLRDQIQSKKMRPATASPASPAMPESFTVR